MASDLECCSLKVDSAQILAFKRSASAPVTLTLITQQGTTLVKYILAREPRLHSHVYSCRHPRAPSISVLLTMAPNLLHLPNGQTVTVTPVFGGFNFKANDLNVHHAAFPPGWTIIIQSEDEDKDKDALSRDGPRDGFLALNHSEPHKHPVRRYRNPTLRGDNLFISSISNPSNNDFKPATSPTRQIAMMLWATLWWYFHQVSTSIPAPISSTSMTLIRSSARTQSTSCHR